MKTQSLSPGYSYVKKKKPQGSFSLHHFGFYLRYMRKLLSDTEISARYFLTCVGLCLESGLMMSMVPKHYCSFPCSLLP